MEIGVHLPQIDFDGEGLSLQRLLRTVDAARECGFAAVSSNDHFLFSRPWLDGTVVLAAVLERSAEMSLMTSIWLPTLRGPVPIAKTLATLDILAGGRMIAGLGPGSSRADYEALGVAFEERWGRLDESLAMVRALLRGQQVPTRHRFYAAPASGLSPLPAGEVPLWVASWGSAAGLRRVARYGDGWIASAYNTDPDQFAAGLDTLSTQFQRPQLPHALVSMWLWITDSDAEAERVISGVVAPMVNRDPESLRERICVGSARRCAELLSRYARAGCQRVHVWPLGDEPRQLDLLASEVMPHVAG